MFLPVFLNFKALNHFKLLRRYHFLISFLGLIWLSFSCSNTKHLSDTRKFVTKSEVTIVDGEHTDSPKKLTKDLQGVVLQKANKRFLGTWLWQGVYNAGVEKKDSANHVTFLMKRGKKPQYLDSIMVNRSVRSMENYLRNSGYFNAFIENEINHTDNTVAVQYLATLDKPYTIGEVFLEIDDIALEKLITDEVYPKEAITTGKQYDAALLGNLRSEIVNSLRENGYYRFGHDAVRFELDTVNKTEVANVFLIVENENDSLYNQTYHIGDIFVSDEQLPKTIPGELFVPYNGKHYYFTEKKSLKHKLIDRYIHFNKGELYALSKQEKTIEQLSTSNLPIVNYTNIELQERDSSGHKLLDAFIYMPLRKLREVSFAPEVSDYDGLALTGKLAFKNKNLLRGGELFELSAEGGFETIGGDFLGASFIRGQAGLSFPRLLGGENLNKNINTLSINPKTDFSVKAGFQNRKDLYTIREIGLKQEWAWSSNRYNRFTWSLIDVSGFDSSNISLAFREYLDDFPAIANSFADRVLLGGYFQYNYINLPKIKNKNNFIFFSTRIDYSGNTFYAINNLFGGKDTVSLFDREISQYVKLVSEFDYHYRFSPKTNFVARINTGIAKSLGITEQVPAVKQFSAGGTSSMRAWSPHSLGPGSVEVVDNIPDQRGDVKLEANFEYRFPFFKLFGFDLNGALFTDVGNIWALEEDVTRPDANISSAFLSELAVGSGIGIRYDLNYFILRADWGFRVKDPEREKGNRWVKTPFQIDNSSLNIGVGYPFDGFN